MERLVEVVQRRARERAQRFVGRTLEVLVEGPSRTDPSRLRGRTRHNKVVNFTGLAAPGELVVVDRSQRATSQTLSGEERLLPRGLTRSARQETVDSQCTGGVAGRADALHVLACSSTAAAAASRCAMNRPASDLLSRWYPRRAQGQPTLVPCRYDTGFGAMEPSFAFGRDGRILLAAWHTRTSTPGGVPPYDQVIRSNRTYTVLAGRIARAAPTSTRRASTLSC